MRLNSLQKLIDDLDPDVIGLQETKVQDMDYPIEAIESMGYYSTFIGQKTHYGVALLSKIKPIKIQHNYPWDNEDAQKRLICADYEIESLKIRVINGYFPQGENQDHPMKYPAKRKFYKDLLKLLKTDYNKDENIVIMGDFNIADCDIDIGIGDHNAKRWLKTGKCAFLPEEREWLQTIKNFGLIDSFRELYPNETQMSWFDYRSRGFDDEPKRGLRIDYIMISQGLMPFLKNAGICYDVRAMEKPSDHAPIWSEIICI